MPIILANQNTGGTFDAFLERGLSQYKPTRASDLVVACAPNMYFVNSPMYLNNMGAMVQAQVTGRPILGFGFPILKSKKGKRAQEGAKKLGMSMME